MSGKCIVPGCTESDDHDFVRVTKDGKSIVHLYDDEPGPVPVTCWFDKGDLGYIADALMDAADRRREKGGRLHERIADHLDDLAVRIHEMKPDGITPPPA